MSQALRSMTGFGTAEGELSARLRAGVRMTSLNGRFLEISLRSQPRLELGELEPGVRSVLAEAISRGRVQVNLELQAAAPQAAAFHFNWEVAAALAAELARRPGGLELAPLALRDLIALPGFAEGMGEPSLTPEEREALLRLIAAARDQLVRDREKEAAALLPQIAGEIATLRSFHGWLGEVNVQLRDALLVRLRERLGRLVEGAVPEERLAVEAGVLADRADVSEEVQRLEAHLAHLDALLGGGGPVGKKLDFLLQELLREVNTSASKCRDAGMGERVVDAKAALEKLREQFANLE